MKSTLRKLFRPILNLFEKGDGSYSYKPSHRKILIAVGCMFSGLATVIVFLAKGQDPTYYLPAVIFGVAGLITLIVGALGNKRAVATIWGSR